MGRKTSGFLLTSVLALWAGVASAGGVYGPAIPGSTEGVGTFFQVQGSDFLNVSVTSSVPIETYIVSRNEMVEICLGKAAVPAADLTVAGLVPGAIYHLYRGDLAAPAKVTASPEGTLAFSVDLAAPVRVLIKVRPSTVFLADGEWTDGAGLVHPPGFSDSAGNDLNAPGGLGGGIGTWDAATRTAVLVKDFSDVLDIRSSFLTLDGDGHTISGGGISMGDSGIYVTGYNTIKNLNFSGCVYSVYLWATSCNIISHCNFLNCGFAAYLQWGSAGGVVENCTIQGGWGGVCFNFVCGGTIVRNNTITGCDNGTYVLIWSGGNQYEGNTFIGNGKAAMVLGDYNTFTGNTFEGNTIGVELTGYWFFDYPVNNFFARNNFVQNGTQIIGWPYNAYNGDYETGGNFWSNWTTPNLDGDRYVDLPFDILDGAGSAVGQDLYPWAMRDGWSLRNLAPVFDAVGSKTVSEYESLTFTLNPVDPEGLPIASLWAENLPPGAAFSPATRTFSWRPAGGQAGVYTVKFFATDSGIPAMTGELDVVITVGDVASPSRINEILIGDILAANLPSPDLANSYLANLKKVNGFIQAGQVNSAVNQMNAFIQKTEQDLVQGKLDPVLGNLWIAMARESLALLGP